MFKKVNGVKHLGMEGVYTNGLCQMRGSGCSSFPCYGGGNILPRLGQFPPRNEWFIPENWILIAEYIPSFRIRDGILPYCPICAR